MTLFPDIQHSLWNLCLSEFVHAIYTQQLMLFLDHPVLPLGAVVLRLRHCCCILYIIHFMGPGGQAYTELYSHGDDSKHYREERGRIQEQTEQILT